MTGETLIMAKRRDNQKTICCFNGTHFRNSPKYLESVFRGLSTLSSGHASVRKDDGVCALHDLYLSADARCEQFESDTGHETS